ncbi:AAA family ATPase [Mycobacterium sp. LTG2003]
MFVNSLPPTVSQTERAVADLTGIKPIVLEHLRELALRLRNQEGYRSQFVALSKPYHTHLGADVDGVLTHLWHEAWAQKGKAVRPAKKFEGGDLEGWDDMDASGEMELVRWMWEDRIPKGEFSILGGYEDSMKSTLAAKIVADITHGKLAGEYYDQPKTVLWFGGEESWNKSIKPRLIAAGADITRVRTIKPKAEHRDEKGRILDLTDPEHVRALRAAIRKHDAALVLFDPMTSHMGAKNVEKEEVLREVLEPLIDDLCHTDGVTLLAIKHFTKLESSDPSKLLGGNRAWSQIARSFIALVLHPDDDKGKPRDARRIVGVQKGNMTGDRTPLMFRPVSVPMVIEGKQVEIATIEWLGEADYTPEEALRTRVANERKPAQPRITCEAWLRDFLKAEGPTSRADVIAACKRERGDDAFSPPTFDKAWAKITDAGDAGPRKHGGRIGLWSLAG